MDFGPTDRSIDALTFDRLKKATDTDRAQVSHKQGYRQTSRSRVCCGREVSRDLSGVEFGNLLGRNVMCDVCVAGPPVG